MVGLIDIAPLTETVDVLGTPVPVYGISARGLAVLFNRFPELRKLVTGMDVGAEELIAIAPDAIKGIIAAGVGAPGDEQQEIAAERLPVDAQLDLIAATLRLTMPKGVGPLVEKLTALGGVAGGVSVTGPVTKSPKPSKNS